MSEGKRYAGKPLLRLLECYVLHAIGALRTIEQSRLEAVTPGLRRAYNRQGSWLEIVAAEMELPPALPQAIRDAWQRNQSLAARQSLALDPQAFAEAFVDRILSD